MKFLSVNAGSSSLKFQVYEMPEEKVLISGYVEKIGLPDCFWNVKINGEKIRTERYLKDHSEAVQVLIDELLKNNVVKSLDEIKGVGHRVVHAGETYSNSVVITDEVMNVIKENIKLAPLHNPGNIVGIEAMQNNIENAIKYIDFKIEYLKKNKNLNNVEEIKLSKYQKASHKVLYYMLMDEKYINLYKNTLGYFKERNERILASEIVYYKNNIGNINIADFTTYLMNKEEEYKFLEIILSENGNTSISDEEFESCVKVILDIYKKDEILKVKELISSELDQTKKEELIKKFTDLKRKCE